jgi:hypothetical protein
VTLAPDPPRAGPFGAAVGVAAVLSFSPALLVPRPFGWLVVLALVALAAAAWRWGERTALHGSLFCALVVAVLQIPGIPWPLPLVIAFAAHGLLGAIAPPLRGGFPWMRRGAFGRDVALLTAGTALLAGAGLALWFHLARPDVANLVSALRDRPAWALVVGGLLFAVVNAAAEEAAWRGAILHTLDASFGPGLAALLVQAGSFGLFHVQGFPRGWTGVLLAAATGLILGALRRRARGMLAPWLARVGADLAVVVLLTTGAR